MLVLVVIGLGSSIVQQEPEKPRETVVNLRAVGERKIPDATPEPKPDPAPEAKPDPAPQIVEEPQPSAPAPSEPAKAQAPVPVPSTRPVPVQQAPSLIRLSRRDMPAAEISAPPGPRTPPAGDQPMMGPADTGPAVRDTPRVGGSGPNGEPLYAVSWYRQPDLSELSKYLPTTSGPGWALITCRTASEFRLEDCVKVDEYPAGSNIARAALTLASQFRVRPPRIGGQSRIGEWVRIRIDYQRQP